MAKLLSGTRIYGNATVDTNLVISGNTISTNTTTGALTVAGGAGIVGNLNVGNLLTASGGIQSTPIGNLTASTGQFTTISATGNITGAALTSNGSVTAQTTLSALGGIQATPIGNVVASSGQFTTVNATGNVTGAALTSNNSITAQTTVSALGGLQATPIGNVVPSTAIFTSESVSGNSTVNGLTVNTSGVFTTTLQAQGGIQATPIGNETASSGQFTTISATGNVTGAALTSNASITAATTLSALGGIQATPIGNVVPSTALFTTVGASGNTTISALTVNNSATFGSNVGIAGNVVIAGNLTVSNVTYLNQEIISNTEIVAGNLTANGLVINTSGVFGTTLQAQGGIQATPIGNVVPSTGLFTSIGSSGNTTVSGLTVNGSATIGTNLSIGSNLTVTGTSTFVGNILGNTTHSANIIAAGFYFANGTAVGTGGGGGFTTVNVADQSNVSAATNAGTLVFASGDGIRITTNANTSTVTISAVTIPFSETADFRFVTEAVTNSADEGLITDAVSSSYDLGDLSAAGSGGTYGNANVASYLLTYTGNISAGNLTVIANANIGNVFATSYYWANGTPFISGSTYSNANVASYLPVYTGNLSAGNISTTTIVSGNILPTSNVTYDLGSPTQRWRDLWLSNTTIHIGSHTIGIDNNNAVAISGNTSVGNLYANSFNWANGSPFSGGGGGGVTYTASNTAPSSPSVGDQWYKISNNKLYEYISDGTSEVWVDIQSPTLNADGTQGTSAATRIITEVTATAGQTTFTIPDYVVGFVDVYQNGARLAPSDFIANSSPTVQLVTGASAGDTLEFDVFNALLFVGNISSEQLPSSISIAGNLTASYVIGNGSLLTGLPAGYTNANVNSYLASNSAVNITTTGNITANSVIIGTTRVEVNIPHPFMLAGM